MGPEIWYCWGISRTVLSSLSRPVFSRIFPEFSLVTRPENISLVPVPPIREMSSSLVSFKTSSGMQTSTWIPNAILSSPDMNYFPFKVGRGFYQLNLGQHLSPVIYELPRFQSHHNHVISFCPVEPLPNAFIVTIYLFQYFHSK